MLRVFVRRFIIIIIIIIFIGCIKLTFKMPLKIKVGGMQRSKPLQVKKVPPPIIPEMNANRNSNPSFTANNVNGRNSCVTNAPMDDNYPPSPLSLNHNSGRDLYDNSVYITGNGGCPASSSPVHNSYAAYPFSGTPQHLAPVLLNARPPVVGVNVNSAFSQPNSPHPSEEGSVVYTPGTSYLLDKYAPTYQQQTSLEDQGIDVQSPGRDSPSSSGSSSGSGCRHSITSLDSGRASSSAYDGRSGHTYLAGPNQHRLSGHSYESSTSLRQSYHSSSSSLGSMDRLDDNGGVGGSGGGGTYSSAQINVCKLLSDGVPEMEVLRRWLSEHRFEEYFHLFVQAGYDMPTISRMTPEDLTAIGITNPSHRKKLKVEIGKLNISDGLPEYIPNLLDEWLQLLRLEEYLNCLIHQGYNTVEDVLGIAWEDLEEIGIQKLGHQKKIMLAIKRVKDIQAGVKRFSSAENRPALEVKCRVLSPPSSGVMHYQGYAAGQDVTLNCTSALPTSSPASENLPSFHSFHQTASEAVDYIPYGAYGPSSPSHIIYRPDIVAIQVRHPSGARSLENLEDGRENRHRTFLQTDSRWTVANNVTNNVGPGGGGDVGPAIGANVLFQGVGGTSPAGLAIVKGPAGTAGVWRRGSFDDGDLTPTNEGVAYEVEGGGTLPRPKVSIKPRPVAKIMAKTRIPAGDSDIILRDAECDVITVEKKGLESAPTGNPVDTHAHNSPRRSLPGSPLNSILRNKKVPPPPPPKRCNSISKADRKSDKSRGGSLTSCASGNSDYSNEQLFASCVKSIASKFGLTRKSDWNSHGSSPASPSRNSSNNNKDGKAGECLQLSGPNSGAQTPEDEMVEELSLDESEMGESADRTPPSPAPGSPVHLRRDPTLNSSSGSGDGLSPDLSCSPLFNAKRNESTSSFDSSGSTSSGESNTLPFANENVGTIKQRAIKPHPTLTTLDLACSPRGSPVLASKNGSIPGSRSAPATPKRRSSLGSDRLSANTSATTPLKEVDIIDDGDLRKPFRAQETGDVLNDIDNMLANLTEELDAMLTSDLQSE